MEEPAAKKQKTEETPLPVHRGTGSGLPVDLFWTSDPTDSTTSAVDGDHRTLTEVAVAGSRDVERIGSVVPCRPRVMQVGVFPLQTQTYYILLLYDRD